MTRGAPLSWTDILASIRPADNVFTGVLKPGGETGTLIGQIHQSPKLSTAKLHYLLVPDGTGSANFLRLMEALIIEAGLWGAKQVVGEVAPDTDWFVRLREAGFSVWTKQRIYRMKPVGQDGSVPDRAQWRFWTGRDIPAMSGLHATLVPPLIQPIEPLTRREKLGLVSLDASGGLQAYADLVYGPAGIWVLPFIHPRTVDFLDDLLRAMLLRLPDLAGRSVFLALRSYQPWIERSVRALAEEEGPEQALMVRHLAVRQRVMAGLELKPLENGTPEPTIPIAPLRADQDEGRLTSRKII